MIHQDEKRDYKLCKASLLDIPFIFHLIQDGSLSGSFSDSNLTSKGYITVFSSLFLDVLHSRRFVKHKTHDIRLLILIHNNENIGFIKITSPFTNENVQVIDLCAIKPEHRNQKHGTQLIRMVIEDSPSGTEIFALCTKYSRAMQRIFKNLKFRRDKKTNNLRLESYRITKPPLTLGASPDTSQFPMSH